MKTENYGNANETFFQRQSHINIAEELFQEWAERKNYSIYRLGFTEKSNPIQKFYNLSDVLRNVPDYVIERGDKLFVVNVKGTGNIKQKEYRIIPELIKSYSSSKSPLIYAFCFKGYEPIFKTAEDVMRLYEQGIDSKWNDGIVYRHIKL